MAADDGGAGEGEDVLFRELQTTSVYDSLQRTPSERHILTLSRAQATYQDIGTALTSPGASAVQTRAPEIVVQVRKRAGATQLLIDGYVSEGTPDPDNANARVHKLEFHKGLHEDAETNTRIFTPIAVVAATEDGQHPLQSVRVALVHAYRENGVVVGESTVTAEASLVPHRVTDVRCNVVRAPYPLVFGPTPTVHILDDSQADLAGRKLLVRQAVEAMSGVAIRIGANYLASNATAIQAAVQGLAIATPTTAVFLVATVASGLGWSFTTALLNHVAPNAYELSDSDDLQRRSALAVQVGMQTLNAYMRTRPAPKPKEVSLSLEEFAKALETISVLRAMQNDDAIDPSTVSKLKSFSTLRAVWNWLTNDTPSVSNLTLRLDNQFTTGVHVRISIDDPMACNPTTQHHEIRCGRADAHVLGAAAAGTIRSMQRVRAAIDKIMRMLDSGADDDYRGQTWFDRTFIAPAWYVTTVLGRRARQTGLKGLLANAKTHIANVWEDDAGAWSNTLESRKGFFQEAKGRVKAKLFFPFLDKVGPGEQLLVQLSKAVADMRVPRESRISLWVRRLPQRVRARAGVHLFANAPKPTTEYADAEVNGVLTRQYTQYEAAATQLALAMRAASLALARFVPVWEASRDAHIALYCVCQTIASSQSTTLKPPPRHSTLALSTPADIQFSAAIASVPERTQRRLRLVASRALQESDKSVLEALGLKHTNADLLACQVFGDLWIAELMSMHEARSSKQLQMLEQASSRAAARLAHAGDLLLRLVAGGNPTNTLEDDDAGYGAPSTTDVALVATQAGRDAGLLLDRVLFSQDYAFLRAAMVPLIRNAAYTAKRAATVFEKRVPARLPHGPTASLFGDRHDGVAAFLRAKSLTGDATLVQAITAAYPSARLLEATGEFNSLQVVALRGRSPTKRLVRMTTRELVAAMRFRLASLQMEPALNRAEELDIDELAEALTMVELGQGKHRSYYVPFGFGDARPAPTFPPCAAPMFGTVPVFCDALAYAFGSLLRCLRDETDANPPKRPLCIRLKPVLDCLHDPGMDTEVEAAHPNTVHVIREDACMVATFAASRAVVGALPSGATPLGTAVGADTPLPVVEVTRAAEAHVSTPETAKLAARVSSIAWNAERVMQAVVAALASADPSTPFDAVEITLELPPDGDERSYWHSVHPAPFAIAQKRRHDELHAKDLYGRLSLLTKLHLDWLNAAMRTQNAFDVSDVLMTGAMQSVPDDVFTQVANRKTLNIAAPLANLANRQPLQDWTAVANARDSVLDALGSDQTPAFTFTDEQAAERASFLNGIADAQRELRAHLRQQTAASTDPTLQKVRTILQVPDPPDSAPNVQSNEPSRRALVGAMGVGMAMLVPLLQNVRVSCAGVERVASDRTCRDAIQGLVGVFTQCAAVRLSEACLLTAAHVHV